MEEGIIPRGPNLKCEPAFKNDLLFVTVEWSGTNIYANVVEDYYSDLSLRESLYVRICTVGLIHSLLNYQPTKATHPLPNVIDF